MINLIVACDLNGGIGYKNKLLTNLRDDLDFFKKKTINKPIIMGRKTFESLPFILPKRKHIIISRNYKSNNNDLIIVKSLDEAIEKYKEENPYIIGGGEIYKESIIKKIPDVIYQTLILNRLKSDTFIPDFYDNYELKSSKMFKKGENNSENFIINKYIKK